MARATRLQRNARRSLFGNHLPRLRRIEALEPRALLAADVYVNDNWVESVNHAGGTAGVVEVNDVVSNSADAGQPPQGGVFGVDAFATIQGGIAGVDPLGTVHVLQGDYVENVIVDKSLHLSGNGRSIVTLRPAVSGPAVGEIGSLPAGASSIVLVQADNVEISGITLDGDNASLASGAVVGGADIDARNGIITNHRLLSSIVGLNVHDVAVQNVFFRGIQSGPGSGTFTFAHNFVTNVHGDFDSIGIANFGGSGTISGNAIDSAESGIVTDGSRGTTITANGVAGARVGIGSYNQGTLGASTPEVIGGPSALDGNTIDQGVFGNYGIVVVNANSDVSVEGNSVSDASSGISVLGGGGSVALRGNSVSRTTNQINSIGILVTNEELDSVIGNVAATLSGNNVSGFDIGVGLEQLVGGATSVSIISGTVFGGDTGIVLAGGLTLTGGTLGSLEFSGQSGDYITMASGALDNLTIDAAAVTFDGLTGAAMTPAERAALETRITHEPDDAALGLVVVAGVNAAPVAADQTLTADEDAKIEGKVTATDADGDTLTFSKVSDPATGALVLNSDGAFTYTPAANFSGSVDFTFQADDGKGGVDTGKVTLTLTPVNDPPDATNDVVEVGDESNVINVLGNDVDPEGGKLTVTEVTQGTGGTVAIGVDGANVIYTPNLGFAGSDIFTYTVTDPEGGTDTATVLVTVTGGPDPGIAGTDGDDVFYVKRDATGTRVEVFANDTGTGAPIFSALIDTTPQLTFDVLGGNDRLIVDWVNGDPVPLSGIWFLGGDGNDSLAIEGGDAASLNGFIAYESGKGTNTLNVQNGSARIDSTVAADGSLDTTVAAGAELITNRLRQNGLVLSDGASVLIRPNGTDAATSVLTSLTMGPGATLDITNNALVVDYTGDSPASTIRDSILSGRGGPGLGQSWTGAGITSSSVAEVNEADPESRSVGFAENASLPLGAYAIFRGVAVDDTAVLIAYTRTADANFDGLVNDDDVTIVGASYAPGAANGSWALGDFDYNGFVDDDDVTLLGAFYNPLAGLLTPAPVGTLAGHGSIVNDRIDAELIDLVAESIAIGGDTRSASLSKRYASLARRVFGEENDPWSAVTAPPP